MARLLGDSSVEMAPDRIVLSVTSNLTEPEQQQSIDGQGQPTNLKAALVVQYISMGVIVLGSIFFIIMLVMAARLSKEVKGLKVLGSLSCTRIVLCGLALFFSVAHVLRLPLSTYVYGFGDLTNVVNGLVISFGEMHLPDNTETILCRVYLTLTSATILPMFLLMVLHVLRIPMLATIPSYLNTHVMVRSLLWCIPVSLVYAFMIWLEPLLNTFVMQDYIAMKAPWVPTWIYKVTGTDKNCPDETFVADESLSSVAGQPNTAGANESTSEMLTNQICEYCTYPITVTCASFLFCAAYLLLIVVTYANISPKIVNSKLLFRLRLLLILYTVLTPLLVCVQAVLVIPMLNMVTVQVVWICCYIISAIVLAGAVLILCIWQMYDASKAAKHLKTATYGSLHPSDVQMTRQGNGMGRQD